MERIMIPIGKNGRVTEGKQCDFTKADLTGWAVRVETEVYYDSSDGSPVEMYKILIAKDFDKTGQVIVPYAHPLKWTPDCGFDYLVDDRQLLEQWFQEAGLEVDWPE
jgi:hypothetical protein